MFFTNIFKIMSVLSFITLSLAAKSKNKCEEIEDYLDSIENVYHQGDYINICELNDKGDVIEAFFDSYDDDLSEEDLLPVLKKYNTYEKLLIRNFQLTQKSIDLIKAYPNLTELKIERQHLDTSVNFDNGFKKLTSFHLSIDENELYNIPKTIYSLKNLEKLELKDYNYTKQDIEGIAKLTNLKELIISQSFEEISIKKFDFSPLKKLSNLTSLSLYNFPKNYPEFINSLTGLKKLYLKTYDELKTIPEGLLNLKNLEILDLSNNKISDLPSNIKNLKNLKTIILRFNAFSKIPDNIKYLTNLKELNLSTNEITKFSSVLESLKNLEILNLSQNNINDKLPEYLNNLSHLKEIYLNRNVNISGRSLTNKNLKVCEYGYSYKDFCSDPKSVCEDYPYDKCINNDDKISTDGTCGKGKGKCPSGKCCSKYGYCGTTDKHCLSGCQSEFGKCKQNISTDGKCGKDNGNTQCPDDKCCSKYGYCGTTEKHCLSGCQSEFGKCGNVEEKISNNDKCGSTYGKCPDNKCCSKYGWCGKTSEYCGSGCQSQFGKCA